MKKQLIKCMLVAVALGMVASINANADDENINAGTESKSDSSIVIDRSDNVSLMSDNAAQEGITAVSMSLNVKPTDETDTIEDIVFDFADSDDVKIAEYRYHEDTGQLNIYMADAKPLFRNSNAMKLGSVVAADAEGNSVDIDITVPENSLSMLSKDELTTTDPKFDNRNIPLGTDYMEIQKVYPTSYLITIPDGSDAISAGDKFTIKADNVLIEHSQMLEVSVSSENDWNLRDRNNPENSEEIRYVMGFGDDNTEIENKSETVLSVTDGRTADSVELTVLDVKTPHTAGTFADTLTFSITVE